MTALRLIAYTPNGASLGPLPNPLEVQAAYPLNDVGALSLSYHPDAARSDLLGQPLEIATEVSTDGGLTWSEPRGGRFLYLRDGRDPIKSGDAYTIEAPSYVWRLNKALVGTEGLDADGRRTYTAQTPGAILNDLWGRALARGALQGMTAFWSPTQDALGTPWPEVQTISYDPGMSLLAVLQGMVEAGWVDFAMDARALSLFVEGNSGGDRTVDASPVSLRFGRDLTEAPFRRTWEGLADTAVVLGDNGQTVTRTNPAALKPWGIQETYVSASGVEDAGTLSVLGDAALTYTEGVRAEHTFGLTFGAATHLPFRDYWAGDWVYAATTGTEAPSRMRVRQVTLTRGDDGQVGGNVVLNDRFLEADVLQNRRIQKITAGATQSGTGTTPSGTGPDILAPKQVVGLVASSAAYVDAAGFVRSQITLDWSDVTTNADNTPASDIAGYEVWARIPTQFDWRLVASTTVSAWSNSPYEPGQTWEFKVRAFDTSNNIGAFSAVASTTTALDFTAPPAPSTPTGTTRLGTARITWDGLSATGANMADTVPDFRYVTVHVSAVSGFTPDEGNRVGELSGAGYAIAGPLNYNATYYARLVAYDSSGNASPPSTQVALVVMPLVDVSNFPDDAMEELYARTGHFLDLTADNFSANLIQGMWIQAGAITADKLTIGSASQSMVLNGNFQDVDAAGTTPLEWLLPDNSPNQLPNPDMGSNTTGWGANNGTLTPQGTYVEYVSTVTLPSGNHNFYANAITVSPGDTLEYAGQFKSQVKAFSFGICINWYTAGGAFISQSAVYSAGDLPGTQFTELRGTATAPATAGQARLLARPVQAMNAGDKFHFKGGVLKGAPGTLSVETATPLSGTKSAKVTLPRYSAAILRPTRTFPVQEGFTYYCRVVVRLSSTLPAGSGPGLLLYAGTSDATTGPYTAGQAVAIPAAGQTGGTVYVIEGTITIAAGNKVAYPAVNLNARTAGIQSVVIDDMEWRPATPDAEITTVGAGKIRTGILQATERIVAGNLTGARAEMNGVGFQSFASDGRKMFEVQANSGETVVGDGGAIHLRLGSFNNIYTGANQGLVRFVNAGSSWGDGQITSEYFTESGQPTTSLRMSSPYNAGLANGWQYAAWLDLRSNAAGGSAFYLKAQTANFTGNTFIWGSGDGSTIDFRDFGSGGFQFSDYGQTSRLRMIPQAGLFTLRGADSTGAVQQLRLQGLSVSLSAGGQEVYMSTSGSAPALAHFEKNVALEYLSGVLRVVNWARSAFLPIHASAFTVNSDAQAKTNQAPVTGALAALKALEVYDYDMAGVLPRKALKAPRTAKVVTESGEEVNQVVTVTNRARGVMAQDVKKVLPDAVHEDAEGRLSVSLYDLLATTMAAVKELSAQVDTLKSTH